MIEEIGRKTKRGSFFEYTLTWVEEPTIRQYLLPRRGKTVVSQTARGWQLTLNEARLISMWCPKERGETFNSLKRHKSRAGTWEKWSRNQFGGFLVLAMLNGSKVDVSDDVASLSLEDAVMLDRMAARMLEIKGERWLVKQR